MKSWIWFLLAGLLSIAFGIYVLGNTVVASIAVTAVTGAFLLIAGGVQVVAGFGAEGTGNKALAILLGALMLFLGWSFLSNPLEGMISLTVLITVLLLASGLTRILLSFQAKGTGLFWPILISGAVSLLLAAVILMNFGAASLSLLGILLGIELLTNGVGLTFLSLFFRNLPVDAAQKPE